MRYHPRILSRWCRRGILIAVIACLLGGIVPQSFVPSAIAATAEVTLIRTLDNPNGIGAGGLGFAMDSVGDINGDGVPEIAIGAYIQTVNGRNSQGQAYLFSGADGSLLYTLNDPYPQTYAYFGSAVSGIGDINGDTVPDIAIGATHQRLQQGQVFVFSGANGSLLYAINNPYPTQIAIFGKAISGGGDLNGDARPDFVVGGYGIWNRWAGKLMVFSGKDGSLLYAKDDPNPVSGSFGDDVEMIGDVDGDSVADILVGAWEHEMAGQAFVYSGASGTLLYTLNHPNPTGGFYSFGRGLEGIGDVSGDNIPDLVVGAATDDGADEMQGRAFVFSGADGSLLFPLENPEPKQEGLLGFSIADIGDYNGDRLSDIAVTALGNERTYIFSGADGSALASVGGGWQVINVGDITGDGYPDIATSNETTRRVALYSLHGDVPYKNLLRNPSFENGTVPWKFWSDGEATFTTESPGYIGDYAARIDIIEPGDNVQLYQKGFPLKAASYYRLEFAARSATGHDVALYVHRHTDPYTNYGLRNFRVNLTDEWDTYSVTFRTKNITTTTNDTRLRLWLKPFDEAGDIYWFDSILLAKVDPPVAAAANADATAFGDIHGRVQLGSEEGSAIVTLIDMESEGQTYSSMVQTDSTGAYQFNAVPYGLYELQVETPDGYLPAESVQLAVSDMPNEAIDFVLDEITSTLYLPVINH